MEGERERVCVCVWRQTDRQTEQTEREIDKGELDWKVSVCVRESVCVERCDTFHMRVSV